MADASMASAQVSSLCDLHEDVLLEVARHVFAADLKALLSLTQTGKRLRNILQACTRAQTFCWRDEMSHHSITDMGVSVVCTAGDTSKSPWASGRCKLPTIGKSAWQVRVLASHKLKGDIYIGVSDGMDQNAWALFLRSGFLTRHYRNEDGHAIYGRSPPEGWPDGHGNRVTDSGLVGGKEVGAVIGVEIDHSEGTLHFRIDGGTLLLALTGFPEGAQLRPWARLCHEGDQHDRTNGEPENRRELLDGTWHTLYLLSRLGSWKERNFDEGESEQKEKEVELKTVRSAYRISYKT